MDHALPPTPPHTQAGTHYFARGRPERRPLAMTHTFVYPWEAPVSPIRWASPSEVTAADVDPGQPAGPSEDLLVGREQGVTSEQGCGDDEPVCGVFVETFTPQSDGAYCLRTMQRQFP